MNPSPHLTDVVPTHAFGARRYQARCKNCEWRGELRRDLEDATSDGELHEAMGQQTEDAAA